MFAILFILGSVLGFLAIALSIIWQKLDGALDKRYLREHETATADDTVELNAKFQRLQKRNDNVRVVGVTCLYSSCLCIFLAAIGFGIDRLDNHYNNQQEQCHGQP